MLRQGRGRLIVEHGDMKVQDLYDQLDAELRELRRTEARIRDKRNVLDQMVRSTSEGHAANNPRQLSLEMEDTHVRGVEREFTITLGETNYAQGFFNVPVISDGLIEGDDCRLILPDGLKIGARVTRNQNRNGTARIFGAAKLKHWFQDNFKIGMEVPVYIVESSVIMMGHHASFQSEVNGHSTQPISRLAEYLPGQSGLRS